MAQLKLHIHKIANQEPLTYDEATEAFSFMMSGQASDAQIAAFLMALHIRGETIDEIVAAIHVIRDHMLPVTIEKNALDIVGTGGDYSGSYNISTASAFVIAAAGVPVAKHGNRALSSRSGSADILKILGVNIEATPKSISYSIDKIGLGFMFAPHHHPVMRYVARARTELGIRTIFNIIGPLTNPASVKKQLVGVFSPEWILPVAETLQKLGSHSFWVVHGNGLDELTTTGETIIAAFKEGKLTHFTLSPADAGLHPVNISALKGGTAQENASALLRLFQGEAGPYRDIVLLNAAAAFIIADKTSTLKEGVALAQEVIDNGGAQKMLDQLIFLSNMEFDSE